MATPVVASIIGLTPYLVETTTLLVQFLETLRDDDLDEDDAAALDAVIQQYDASAARRDAALDALRAAIAARRNQNPNP